MKDVECFFAETKKAYSKLDVLLHNAGEIFLILEDCHANDAKCLFHSLPQFETEPGPECAVKNYKECRRNQHVQFPRHFESR